MATRQADYQRYLIRMAKAGNAEASAWYANKKKQIVQRERERRNSDPEYVKKRRDQSKRSSKSPKAVARRSTTKAIKKQESNSRIEEKRRIDFGELTDSWIACLKKICRSSYPNQSGMSAPSGSWDRRIAKMAYAECNTKRKSGSTICERKAATTWDDSLLFCIASAKRRAKEHLRSPWEKKLRSICRVQGFRIRNGKQ